MPYSDDLQHFIDTMTARGFKVCSDPLASDNFGNGVSPKAALRRRFVLAWMPDRETIQDAETMADFPIWLSSFQERWMMDEAGGVLFCGGLYYFMRLFVRGEDITHAYHGAGSLPRDPTLVL